jgi:hypothetical protein
MARSSYAGRGGGGAAPAPSPRRVDPKLKLYNMIRWMNYLLFPFVGVVIIFIGVGMAFANGEAEQALPRTLVIAGGIMAYVSIFYNKR